jgi:uncharacterized protein (UPF0303 family)
MLQFRGPSSLVLHSKYFTSNISMAVDIYEQTKYYLPLVCQASCRGIHFFVRRVERYYERFSESPFRLAYSLRRLARVARPI